ncbi:MAG: 3-phosphoserine/phosphohydroxythreonine transaminase [Flavobacterium sp.]|nr:3-phosphoserine/phosphohydroxythreonine transaminase [Flavobacterium sp.]
MKKHNFSAGPCILPQEVFEKSAQAILNFNQSGLSILEISHRSKDFIAVMEEARALVLELLGLTGKGYQALFLQGGASMEFLRVPHNLMPLGGQASYLDTGTWANNAIKEAKLFGDTVVVASSKNENYNHIPTDYIIPETASYFHCTSNNTIFGTQIKQFPQTAVPMICDMSSDIFSRSLDFSQFDLIYAGAQKNMGPAGTTLIIIKESILGKTGRSIPSMMDYEKHIKADSMYNTPAVLPVYSSLLTLQWLKNQGGIAAIEKKNEAKAQLLYNEIDRNPLFIGTANKADRSSMNATFLLVDSTHQELFDSLWKAAGISGLPGHRSVGGYRASMYNALPIESVQVLVDAMQELEKQVK